MIPTTGDRRYWRSVALFWLVACAILTAVTWPMIAAWRFPDPDDQLRLIEVRDWLAGQGWFDVAQYRLNAPAGVPMHWSRLVDLPIAGIIVVLTPLIGVGSAETTALVVVPLVTLGATLAALAVLAQRLLPDEPALLAVCLSPLCVEVVHQLRPMRIDHHGWQMALTAAAAAALMRRGWRAGCIAGGACGLWLAISLEGLPMALAILGLAALRWALDPGERALARAATASAAIVALAAFAVTHRWSAWSAPVCDALSPVYLALLATATAGTAAVTALPIRTRSGRLAALAVIGVVALAMIPLVDRRCAAGPFAALDPLVRGLWYDHVMEGLPIWRQLPFTMAGTLGAPLLGLAGAAWAIRDTRGEARTRWASLCFLLAAATLAALLVQRATGVANLLAMPGIVRLVFPLLLRARAIAGVPGRLAATLACLILAVPGLDAAVAIITLTVHSPATRARDVAEGGKACTDGSEMAALSALPRGTILAPLDISPSILLLTPHRAVASGHHRGMAAMHDVIAAWTGPAATARAIVMRRHVDYVAFCPGLAEIATYETAAPAGFLAQLDRGAAPRWLVPVAVPGSPIRVWRVVAPALRSAPARPLSEAPAPR